MCCRKKRARRAAKEAALIEAMSEMRLQAGAKQASAVQAPAIQAPVMPPPESQRELPPDYDDVLDQSMPPKMNTREKPYKDEEANLDRASSRRSRNLEAYSQHYDAPTPVGRPMEMGGPQHVSGPEHYHHYQERGFHAGATPYVPWFAYNNRPIARGCRAWHRSRCHTSVCWCHTDVSRLRV